MLVARNYQTWGVEVLGNFLETKKGHPLFVAPTATGKSVIIALFLKRYVEANPTHKILVLTHVREIISQNVDKLKRWWPEAPVSIFSAGLNVKDYSGQIVNAGIASIKSITPEGINLVIVDECHLVSDKDTTMYHKFFKKSLENNPDCRWVGFTATPWRQKIGHLTNGGVFTDTAVDMTKMEYFNWFFDEGYLCKLVTCRPNEQLKVNGIKITAGEYNQKALQEAVDKDKTNLRIVEQIILHGHDRKHWLVFASGLEHAENLVRLFELHLIRAKSLDSESLDRAETIQAFESGEIRCLVVYGLLTTGYDFDALDLIAVVRPTCSVVLWVQMLGRGDRPYYAPGFDLSTREGRLAAIAASNKPNCLVLDFAGNTKRLGPINDPVIPTGRRGNATDQPAPVRLCEKCSPPTYVHASLKVCPNCGNVFPLSRKIVQKASQEEVIRKTSEPRIEEYKIDAIRYTTYIKERPSLCVSYYSGHRVFREWICFEHSGIPKQRAYSWWKQRCKGSIPETVSEAVQRQGEIARCVAIKVKTHTKYPEIVGYTLQGDANVSNIASEQTDHRISKEVYRRERVA